MWKYECGSVLWMRHEDGLARRNARRITFLVISILKVMTKGLKRLLRFFLEVYV
jgi:hypothetical protein